MTRQANDNKEIKANQIIPHPLQTLHYSVQKAPQVLIIDSYCLSPYPTLAPTLGSNSSFRFNPNPNLNSNPNPNRNPDPCPYPVYQVSSYHFSTTSPTRSILAMTAWEYIDARNRVGARIRVRG